MAEDKLAKENCFLSKYYNDCMFVLMYYTLVWSWDPQLLLFDNNTCSTWEGNYIAARNA